MCVRILIIMYYIIVITGYTVLVCVCVCVFVSKCILCVYSHPQVLLIHTHRSEEDQSILGELF